MAGFKFIDREGIDFCYLFKSVRGLFSGFSEQMSNNLGRYKYRIWPTFRGLFREGAKKNLQLFCVLILYKNYFARILKTRTRPNLMLDDLLGEVEFVGRDLRIEISSDIW